MSKHTPETPAFAVGDRVVALREFYNDLTGDGMGMHHCASKGDLLIVRGLLSTRLEYCIAVSHEHVTDRAFCVSPSEIRLAVSNTEGKGA